MKTLALHVAICVAILLPVGSNAFASPTPTATPRKSPSHKPAKIDESEKPPFIGMTKAQALARYGKPKKQTVTNEGEQWVYWLNFGEFMGKHMIPFFFSTEQIRIGVLTFGPDGRVKKFTWDTPSD